MFDSFLAKCFEWLWQKGFAPIMIWLYGSYHIANLDKAFGYSLTDPDKGIMLTFFSMLCAAFYFRLKVWIEKQRYYSPKSFGELTTTRVLEIRDFCDNIRRVQFLWNTQYIPSLANQIDDFLGTAEDVGELETLLNLKGAISRMHIEYKGEYTPAVNRQYQLVKRYCNEFRGNTLWAIKNIGT